MRFWKKIIRVGDSMGIILDKTIINGLNVKLGDKILIDIEKVKGGKN